MCHRNWAELGPGTQRLIMMAPGRTAIEYLLIEVEIRTSHAIGILCPAGSQRTSDLKAIPKIPSRSYD